MKLKYDVQVSCFYEASGGPNDKMQAKASHCKQID